MARGRGIAAAALVAAFAVTADAGSQESDLQYSAAYSKVARSTFFASGQADGPVSITCGPTDEGIKAELTVNGAFLDKMPGSVLNIAQGLFFGKTRGYAFGDDYMSESSTSDYAVWATSDYHLLLDYTTDYTYLKESSDAYTSTSTEMWLASWQVWKLLTPLAIHSTASRLEPSLRVGSIATSLVNTGCTINGLPLPADVTAPIDAGECVEPIVFMGFDSTSTGTTTETTTTDYTQTTITNTTFDAIYTVNKDNRLCTWKLECPNMGLNTRWAYASWKDPYFQVGTPLQFGGYACPNGNLVLCNVNKMFTVAAPDASGCIGEPGYFVYDAATGSNLDTTGMAIAGACNVPGSDPSLHSAGNTGACACYSGYTGVACDQCEPGFVSTKYLLGDGIHSLTSIAEVYSTEDNVSDMHDYQNQPSNYDYDANGYEPTRDGGIFCIKDVTSPAHRR